MEDAPARPGTGFEGRGILTRPGDVARHDRFDQAEDPGQFLVVLVEGEGEELEPAAQDVDPAQVLAPQVAGVFLGVFFHLFGFGDPVVEYRPAAALQVLRREE